MISKTRCAELVKAQAAAELDAALASRPDLRTVRDPRGRTWLHLLAAREGADPEASVATAKVLLAHGLDIDDAAFTEGVWRATPLWHAISRGRNLALARFLLGQGCNPDFCLFAAAWNDDVEAIDLLIAHGAPMTDEVFLEAVAWSRFAGATAFLRHGADPNARDKDGRTALHMMLKKGSALEHLRTIIAHGARLDIPDGRGVTAADILQRKRDPGFRALASEPATAG